MVKTIGCFLVTPSAPGRQLKGGLAWSKAVLNSPLFFGMANRAGSMEWATKYDE
jgi:hypothetical protein